MRAYASGSIRRLTMTVLYTYLLVVTGAIN